MNAAVRKYDRVEDADMPTNENEGLGELRADVRHIQSDVTDIKAEIRITNKRMESLEEKVDTKLEKIDQKIESLRKETGEKIDKLDTKIESVRKETVEIRESLGSAKLWAFCLYIGLAGSLFYVLAHGFKWI